MISQVSSLSLSAASAASRETDRSRYRASGSAAPGTRSKVAAPAQRLTPHQPPFRGSERAFCEHDVKPPRIELLDQFRADADLHLELHARMELGEAAERRRQRAAGDLLDHADTHRARQPRPRQAMTGRFLKLQQATRVAEQHLAIVGQCDAARCPPEQGSFGLELKPLDLLAYR